MQKQEYWEIDDYKLAKIVKQVFSEVDDDFEPGVINEWATDTMVFTNVDGKMDEYSMDTIEKIKNEGQYSSYCVRDVLNYMVSLDTLPEGNYIIDLG